MLLETLEYLGIAFICSVILIIMSKIILQALIRRPADYYNARELMEEELMLNAGGISITHEHETNPEGEIIEEKHLEAQLGDSEAAEPEEIMIEIPDAIAESIEVHQEEKAEENAPEPEAAVEEVIEEEAEPDKDAEMPDNEAAQEPVEVSIEKPAEETAEETEPQAEEEPEPEPEPEEPKTPEEAFGFIIKAKTSRTKKPKRKEEEEAAEELEEAKAAMDEAKARASENEPVSEWTESYAEIRDSLEKAFTERRRKPSMHMNKKELIDIATEMGIELPNKVTKREILDLINEVKE